MQRALESVVVELVEERVDHQESRSACEGAREHQQLRVSVGERATVRRDVGVEPAREPLHFIEDLERGEGVAHVGGRDPPTTESHVLEDRALDQFGLGHQRDVVAERLVREVEHFGLVDPHRTAIGRSQSADQLGERRLARAVRPVDRDPLATRDLHGEVVDRLHPARVSVLHLTHVQLGRAVLLQPLLLATGLEGQVVELTDLVGRREEVVVDLELLAELREGGEDERHDQLGRDQLSEGELPGDHQPTTEGQEGGTGDGMERHGSDHLTEHHAEVGASLLDVTASERVHATVHVLRRPGELVGEGGTRDLLEGGRDVVLRLRLLDRAPDRSAAENEEDERHGEDQDRVEDQEERVVEREDQEAHRGVQHQPDAVEEEDRRRLLDGDHVEETVDELGTESGVACVASHPRESVGQIGCDTDQDATLEDLDDVRLEGADHPREREEREQQHADQDERLDQPPERHEVHERLDRDRGGERQDSVRGREAEDDPDLSAVRGEEIPEASERAPPGLSECWLGLLVLQRLGDDHAHDRRRVELQLFCESLLVHDARLEILRLDELVDLDVLVVVSAERDRELRVDDRDHNPAVEAARLGECFDASATILDGETQKGGGTTKALDHAFVRMAALHSPEGVRDVLFAVGRTTIASDAPKNSLFDRWHWLSRALPEGGGRRW